MTSKQAGTRVIILISGANKMQNGILVSVYARMTIKIYKIEGVPLVSENFTITGCHGANMNGYFIWPTQ